MLFKVPELAAEVDVRDVEMETDSNPLSVPGSASPLHSDDAVHSNSDDAEDSDENDVTLSTATVYSIGSSDSESLFEYNEENLNNDDDNDDRSSVDIRESRTPSPPPAESASLPVEQTAVTSAGENPATVESETSNNSASATALAAENTATQHALTLPDLDNSLACFKTAKRKKPVLLSPPDSKDAETDEAEVSDGNLFRVCL